MAEGPTTEAELIEAVAHVIRRWAMDDPTSDWRAQKEARRVLALVRGLMGDLSELVRKRLHAREVKFQLVKRQVLPSRRHAALLF